MTEVVAISAGLSKPSSTRLLADRLAAATSQALDEDVTIDTVELREYAHDITNHLLVGFGNGRLNEVLNNVNTADGLILVTPVFSGSYSGLFKSFMDIIEPDALRRKPVLLAATGGTERHSLVLEHAMRPLLSYLGALTVPTAVYAASADWGNDADLRQRVKRAGDDLAAEVSRRPRQAEADPFAEPVPFTELLRDVVPD